MATRAGIKPATKVLPPAIGMLAFGACADSEGNVTPTSTLSTAFYKTVSVADLNCGGKLDVATTFT